MTPRNSGARRPLATSPFNKPPVEEPPAEQYALNDRVSHDRHGLGTVTSVEGTSAVTVDFGTEIRRITLPSVKLARL